MTSSQKKVKQHITAKMTMMLMERHGMVFVDALKFLLQSSMYKSLSKNTYLLEQGDLFLYEQLEKEM
ncbi:hypothetical protein SAMN05720766_109126 [Fibrobacter sp. UWH9]|uniref:hypothetical protein n=1 Tax=Fibrobacter sp. UWH9 TaxID=1896213 RepID=UPI0009247511|nr:hypothetical protein [Fibrobacter sp. UWH9]SHH27974.1 hypothetical protein SAMN05720766_109126 [Fibrobacter sp. UWH9]